VYSPAGGPGSHEVSAASLRLTISPIFHRHPPEPRPSREAINLSNMNVVGGFLGMTKSQRGKAGHDPAHKLIYVRVSAVDEAGALSP
jgi:hypothetical protein